MGSKNCPESPRQKMINMMYLVLTAMLALNVAAEVLDAFKVVDFSLLQTVKTLDIKNDQIYSSFEQAFVENPTKVEEWKIKADEVRQKTDSLKSYISQLKEELVRVSGSELINQENPLTSEDFYVVTEKGDTLKIKKEDDLNSPSELMVTQKRAEELKGKIIEFKNELITFISEDDVELKETILRELETPDPPANLKEGTESKSWEIQYFLDKPLVAVLTLLTKMEIDVKNSEANLINYLYAQIDAGSFKFNKLGARVIANSNLILQGDEYFAEVFLAAEDTTEQPEIFINNRPVEVNNGKAIYRVKANEAGNFSWGGLIKYKTPAGIVKNYEFEQPYQVTKPSVTMSATQMNVFYRGLDNPFDIGGGGIPKENLEVRMTNGTVIESGDSYLIRPDELDELGRRTTVSVYANVGGESRLVDTTPWRVKKVPDPVAQVAGQSGGAIPKERLLIEDGVMAVLEDFDFNFKYTVTEFTLEATGQGGYTNPWNAVTNRFTNDQKDQIRRLNPGNSVFITNIKAVGDDGVETNLDPIIFKLR